MPDSKPQPSEWLRLAEAIEILRASESTVRRWADEGHIAVIRTPGGQRRFSRADTERIASHGVQRPAVAS